MSYDKEIDMRIQSHFRDHRKKDISLEEIARWPRWKRVWASWHATANYRDKHFYLSLDEVPDAPDGQWVSIMTDDACIDYQRRRGVLVEVQRLTLDEVKRIYED